MMISEMGATHYLFPQPTVIVGANVQGKPNYLAAAWCGIMQASPPIIYAALNKVRYTLIGIKENETFSICIPSTSMVVETDYVGTESGHELDKSGIFKSFYGKLKTAPMIEECPVNMECKLIQIVDFKGSHEICIGEIVQTYAHEDCLTNGVPNIRKVDPIIYSTGDHNYWKVGEKVGRAYSVGKKYQSHP